jgi:hypothetical protein
MTQIFQAKTMPKTCFHPPTKGATAFGFYCDRTGSTCYISIHLFTAVFMALWSTN